MYKKLTLTEIKQEAKDLKKSIPSLKHSQALNFIAQKYGYVKFEAFRNKIEENSGYVTVKIAQTANPKNYISAIQNVMQTIILDNINTLTKFRIPPSLMDHVEDYQCVAVVGGAGSGKTTLLFREHEYLDRKTTLFITSSDKNSLNGYPHHLEKDGYEKHFEETLPVFRKATFKTFKDRDIDVNKFKTIIIEEALMLKTNSGLLTDIKKIIAGKSKDVILTFQEKEDIKELDLMPGNKEDLRDYDNHSSTSLDLYRLYIGGAGMSYFGNI